MKRRNNLLDPRVKPEDDAGLDPRVKPEDDAGLDPRVKPEDDAGLDPQVKPEGDGSLDPGLRWDDGASARSIDALLPQTQCQLCEFDGCMPYAEALAKGEASIDLCLPGGVDVLKTLGQHLNIDSEPYRDTMREKTKPPSRVTIQESACIGCTKCIRVCPTDAIVGASKQMHTVIADACTGCDLCIPACPVDCIDTVILSAQVSENTEQQANAWRDRYQKRGVRLAREKAEATNAYEKAKLGHDEQNQTLSARQAAIRAAVLRVRNRTP